MDASKATHDPLLRVGLPYASRGKLLEAAMHTGGRILLSANAFWRKNSAGEGALRSIADAPWMAFDAALDSAGFSAMVQGGYRWSVQQYVDFVVTSAGDGCRPFPWTWWAAMDFCCEDEIAGDRAAVLCRMQRTVEVYGETLDALDDWRWQGDTETPDPLPTLQGRTGSDYVRCAEQLSSVLVAHGRRGLPSLVGLGSVCRRSVHGPQGLLPVLAQLDAQLPAHVRLHLFGVKGAALPHIVRRFAHRVHSTDSMAWDFGARRAARAQQRPYDVAFRGECLQRWVRAQRQKMASAGATPQPEQLAFAFGRVGRSDCARRAYSGSSGSASLVEPAVSPS